MSRISKKSGIAKARSKLGLDYRISARVLLTHRVDRANEEYYLIIFGEPQAATGVAAVDTATGEVMVSANLPGTGPHLQIDAEAALQQVNLPPRAQVKLVWKPCKGSRSPLYPLWEIKYEQKTVYVDQQGVVWTTLDLSECGG